MIDKQKAIEEMSSICFEHKNEWTSHRQGFCYAQAEALYKHNYGNIPQALTEFSEKIKSAIEREKKADEETCGKSAYKVGFYLALTNLINETLKEFVPNADIS